ncbi:MAG: hypothetical protein EHM43_07030 [Ignavibacteriae bacterium]|nr:MAG: hypothetical protein EHM43_07030 [Ignavibacteriota bacterium]
MTRFFIALLFLTSFGMTGLLASCSSADTCTSKISKDSFQVTYMQGACMGLCPVYSGTVNGDGSVVYEPRKNTERTGTHTGTINAATLCTIYDIVVKNDVMRLDTNHMQPVEDAPVRTLMVLHNGQRRTIRWNLGTPDAIKPLVELMISSTHENNDLDVK